MTNLLFTNFEEANWWNGFRPNLDKPIFLLDFFTFSTDFCLRDIPNLNRLKSKYKDLEIVGIYSPEYEFEKTPEYIQHHLEKHKINYPIYFDKNFAVWQQYDNSFLPTRYLIDKNGKELFFTNSSGYLDKFNQKIYEYLNLSSKMIELNCESPYTFSAEQFFGYNLGVLANEMQIYDTEYNFVAAVDFDDDEYNLSGQFIVRNDCVQTLTYNAKIEFWFYGKNLNLVLEPCSQEVEIKLFVDDNQQKKSFKLNHAGVHNVFQFKSKQSKIKIGLSSFIGNFRLYSAHCFE